MILWIGIVVIIAMCIVPPWRTLVRRDAGYAVAGTYRPIFWPKQYSAGIDIYRLSVQVFAVALLTAACMYYHGKPKKTKQEAEDAKFECEHPTNADY